MHHEYCQSKGNYVQETRAIVGGKIRRADDIRYVVTDDQEFRVKTEQSECSKLIHSRIAAFFSERNGLCPMDELLDEILQLPTDKSCDSEENPVAIHCRPVQTQNTVPI
jgi:hypothetical protein